MELLKENCAELRSLPKAWAFAITPDQQRILYRKESEREQTFIHPTLGELPRPWILCVQKDKKTGKESVVYLNRDNKATTTKDPRYMKENLDFQSKSVAKNLSIAANVVLNSRKFDITTYARAPIKNHDIRNQFQIVHTIDAGDGKIGGMNGGVFVVRMNGNPSRMFVEKRFKPSDLVIARPEIEMLHRVKHGSLTFYIDAFITDSPPAASLYVEFCDRGSLDNIIRKYFELTQDPKPTVPEAFVWHAFIGLCDGLAYLETGVSHTGGKSRSRNSKWVPVLHRDIKPDNVLLRSRSTLGSGKYFYCVLSDFGLACEDLPDHHPKVNYWQKLGLKCGTKVYWAPEQLYTPYPMARQTHRGPNTDENKFFPRGGKHTVKSDLWALGASIFDLCAGDGQGHMTYSNMPVGFDAQVFQEGTTSRRKVLNIPRAYGAQLRDAVLLATMWEPRSRPPPSVMIKTLSKLLGKSGYKEQGNNEPLPPWTTKVHEYQFSAEKVARASKGR